VKKMAWVGGILFLAFLLAAQVSPAGAQDKKPFKTVGSMPLSGVAGALTETGLGVLDAAEYINKTGRIGGREYVAIIEDGRYDVPATLGIFNKYVDSEPADELLYYCQYNTPALKALQERVNKEVKIPVMAGSMSALIFDEKIKETSPYFFASGPGYGEQWAMVLKYIKMNHKKKTPPRCAFHYYDNSTGRDPMEYIKRYAEKYGVEIAMWEPFAPTAQTFAPSFLKFKKEKIEYVLFWNWSAKTAARWFPEAKKYIPEIPSFGIHWNAGLLYFDLAKEAYDGHTIVSPFPIETETDNKFVKLVTDFAKEKGRDIRLWQVYMQSWQMGLIPAVAGRQLIAEGKPVTRDTLRDQIENIKGYDMMGMYGGQELDFTSHKYSRARFVRADWSVKTLVPISDWVDVYDYIK